MRLYLALSMDFQTGAGTKHAAQMVSVPTSDSNSEVRNAGIMEIVKRFKPVQMFAFTDKGAALDTVKAWNAEYTANGTQMWDD